MSDYNKRRGKIKDFYGDLNNILKSNHNNNVKDHDIWKFIRGLLKEEENCSYDTIGNYDEMKLGFPVLKTNEKVLLAKYIDRLKSLQNKLSIQFINLNDDSLPDFVDYIDLLVLQHAMGVINYSSNFKRIKNTRRLVKLLILLQLKT